MDRILCFRHFLIATTFIVVLATNGCQSYEPFPAEPTLRSTCCSQEMSAILFERLEEQSTRLQILKEALLRTVSILVNDEDFSTASATLKSDPLINSLLNLGDDPTETTLFRSQPMSKWLELQIRGRKKRQTEEQPVSPKERLTQALKWAKKTSITSTDDSVVGRKLEAKKTAENHEIEPFVSDVKSADQQQARTFTSRASTKSISDRVVEKEAGTPPSSISGSIKNNIVPTPSTSVLQSATTTVTTSSTSTAVSPLANQMASQQFVTEIANDLQGAVKCALAQRNETNALDPLGVLLEPQAILNLNDTLTIQFQLKSCQKYWVAVWIHITVRPDDLVYLRSTSNRSAVKYNDQFPLHVPKECLKKVGNTFLLTLPSSAKAPCSFPLKKLMECKIYSVEITPVYFTLHGESAVVEITVPPQPIGNSTDLVSLGHDSLQNSTHVLGLKWSAQSHDCAKLMTSVDLRIYEDTSDIILRSFTVPYECLGNGFQNNFSAIFSSLQHTSTSCTSITWEPLDICRKYRFEVEPEYSSTWRGKPLSLEIFTSGTDRTNCCFMLTSPTGTFRSTNYDGNYSGCTWLISVERNSTIWLTFTEFNIESSYYHLKVYDGPYTTSPLLSEHYGYQPPKPIRSRSNKLFIQLVSQYYRTEQGKSFTAYYMSMNKKITRPYVAGCGGYIVGKGTISKPAYPPTDSSSSECVWYLESSGPRSTILITSVAGVPFPMTVYDGWSEDGKIIYNNTDHSAKASIYSLGNKAIMKFPSWNSVEREREYFWSILTTSNIENCSYNLTSHSDTFVSHTTDASTYSSLIDCRWAIHADNSSKIRLTFVYFDTENDQDFVTIYDGPNVYSSILMELTGKISKPVSLISTTNKFLIRFTTNENTRDGVLYKGFLAFYTTVPCNDQWQQDTKQGLPIVTQSPMVVQNESIWSISQANNTSNITLIIN